MNARFVIVLALALCIGAAAAPAHKIRKRAAKHRPNAFVEVQAATQVKNAFKQWDSNQDGHISLAEFQAGIKKATHMIKSQSKNSDGCPVCMEQCEYGCAAGPDKQEEKMEEKAIRVITDVLNYTDAFDPVSHKNGEGDGEHVGLVHVGPREAAINKIIANNVFGRTDKMSLDDRDLTNAQQWISKAQNDHETVMEKFEETCNSDFCKQLEFEKEQEAANIGEGEGASASENGAGAGEGDATDAEEIPAPVDPEAAAANDGTAGFD